MEPYKVIIDEFRHQFWYNGKDQLHREDGYAVIYSFGRKERWINGQLHCEDGPAIDCRNGYQEWWINGKELTEQEFNNRHRPCYGKIVVVDGIEYTLT